MRGGGGGKKQFIQGDQKVSVYSYNPHTIGHHRIHSQCGPCYTEHGLREQFGVSINVWRLVRDTLNITGNFLYCNHQVHRDFFITLYIKMYTSGFSYRNL
jgi:hypothetical protein